LANDARNPGGGERGSQPVGDAPAPPPGRGRTPDRPLRNVDKFAITGFLPHLSWARDDLWNALFEAAPLPYALYQLSTRRVMANRACAELFGYEHRPLVWFPAESLGHPDDRARTDDLLRRVVFGGEGHLDYEKRYIRSDGSVFHASVHASVVRDESGEAWGALLAIEDITERLAHEHALEASEKRLQALVANTTDAIVVLDAQGQVTFASPSTERLMGDPVEGHLGDEIFQWVHPDDRPIAVEIFHKVLADSGCTVGPLRLRVLRIDGAMRYIEVIGTNLLDDPAVSGVVINIRDLTDSEEAASALEMTETRYRRMLENITDTVALLDRNGRVILTTGTLRSSFGYPSDFWQVLVGFDIVHPDDVEMAKETYERLLARPGSQNSGELRIRTPSGDYRDVEVSAVNLLDTPDVEAIVVTSRDVTDRNNFQRELAVARDQAVEALHERTQFIANVSHELRTPIHGILGLSELLETTDLDDEARSLASSIGRATDSLRMVLDDILDFSKIEVGRLETADEPISVREMIRDIDSLFLSQAQAKGIELKTEIDPGFPEHVRGDALRIRQVLTNLVSNAVKFTSNGSVIVSLRRLGGQPPKARISIRDTGIGIPPEAHDRLFEPFSQAYGDTGRAYGGTGLGLAIAKRLVELMGGELGFSSEPGVGSVFWFTLPLIETAPRPFTNGDQPGPNQSGARRRVLVVEDNAINQLLVRRQLARLGYEPIVVASGDAALATFPNVDADLVLMDWQLPGIDGLETTRQLRTWEKANRHARTPVVAMTASALPGDRERCLEAGMDDFIAKPVSIGTLGATLRRWVAPEDTGPADAQPTLPVVDPHALDVLTHELDDPMLVATVVRTFLRELPGRVDWITSACEDGDPVRLEVMTHTLRSTSLAVGARELAAECERLERQARESDRSAKWDASRLRAAAAAVAAALGDEVGPPSTDG
jgi:PAS domain S-box-containing protein